MTDTNRDLHPDSLPGADTDTRSDIEQAVEARSDDVERAAGGGDTSALDPTVSIDTAGGAGGNVRNQDTTQQ